MPKSYSNAQLRHLASKLGKSLRTLRYWVAQGCDLENEESVRQFAERKAIKGRQTAKAQMARERRGEESGLPIARNPAHERHVKLQPRFEPPGNGELPSIGKKGAAAAL